MNAESHVLKLPAAMLRRGFSLYVWAVDTPKGELLYVGRTGDSSSPNAVAPYTRMSQHLGRNTNQNALRRHLEKQEIEAEDCGEFRFITYGPIEEEVVGEYEHRQARMAVHGPRRDRIAALEKKLADTLTEAKYLVLNEVKSKYHPDPETWDRVRRAFARHFPRLETAGSQEANE